MEGKVFIKLKSEPKYFLICSGFFYIAKLDKFLSDVTHFSLWNYYERQKFPHTPQKSQTNEKNILFQFLCLPLSLKKCVQIWFEMSSVTSVEKRESRKHFSASACSFLGLGLFISRPRPQKCGLGFKKLFLDSLFSTSVTLDKSQIRRGQVCPQTW